MNGAASGLVEPLLRAMGGLDPVTLAAAAGTMAALEATALIGLVLPGDLIVLLAATAVVLAVSRRRRATPVPDPPTRSAPPRPARPAGPR